MKVEALLFLAGLFMYVKYDIAEVQIHFNLSLHHVRRFKNYYRK